MARRKNTAEAFEVLYKMSREGTASAESARDDAGDCPACGAQGEGDPSRRGSSGSLPLHIPQRSEPLLRARAGWRGPEAGMAGSGGYPAGGGSFPPATAANPPGWGPAAGTWMQAPRPLVSPRLALRQSGPAQYPIDPGTLHPPIPPGYVHPAAAYAPPSPPERPPIPNPHPASPIPAPEPLLGPASASARADSEPAPRLPHRFDEGSGSSLPPAAARRSSPPGADRSSDVGIPADRVGDIFAEPSRGRVAWELADEEEWDDPAETHVESNAIEAAGEGGDPTDVAFAMAATEAKRGSKTKSGKKKGSDSRRRSERKRRSEGRPGSGGERRAKRTRSSGRPAASRPADGDSSRRKSERVDREVAETGPAAPGDSSELSADVTSSGVGSTDSEPALATSAEGTARDASLRPVDAPAVETTPGDRSSVPSPPARSKGAAVALAVLARSRASVRRGGRWLLGDGLTSALNRRLEMRVATVIALSAVAVVVCALAYLQGGSNRGMSEPTTFFDLEPNRDGEFEPGAAGEFDPIGEREAPFGSPKPMFGEGDVVGAVTRVADGDRGEGAGENRSTGVAAGPSVDSAETTEAPPPSRLPDAPRDLEEGLSPPPAPARSDHYWFIRIHGMAFDDEAELIRRYFEMRLGYRARLEPEEGVVRQGRQLYAVFVETPFADKAAADTELARLKQKALDDPYEKSYVRDFQGALAVRRTFAR